MKLRTDSLDYRLFIQPNFPLLKRLLSAFQPVQITGAVTLEETPFLKHLRLVFLGTGVFSDTVLYGPSFDRVLLEQAELGADLRHVVEEFFRQIRQLDEFLDAPPERTPVDLEILSLLSTNSIHPAHQTSEH